MSIFTNDKKLCPICGRATPRLLATKVAGKAICSECAGKLDLPDRYVAAMTLKDLREYMEYYDRNRKLRAKFRESWKYNFTLFGGSALVCDCKNHLIRFSTRKESLVFEGSCVISFTIGEGDNLVYMGNAKGLQCYHSEALNYVLAMKNDIDEFNKIRKKHDAVETYANVNAAAGIDEPVSSTYVDKPYFLEKPLFEKFYIDVAIDHKYRTSFHGEIDAPRFDKNEPDIDKYISEYESLAKQIKDMADSIMNVAFPSYEVIPASGESHEPAKLISYTPVAALDKDATAEIKKYKELLDMGAITEEEYNIKKRQLLGF